MFKLIFTNTRGESVEIYSRPFRLISFTGLSDLGATHQVHKSYNQDGSTLHGTNLDERYPEIVLKIYGSNERDLATNRRKIISVFNPKLGEGTLTRVAVDGSTKQLKAVPDALPFMPDGAGNRTSTTQMTSISLYCPNPYWEDVNETIEEVATWIGGFSYPFSFPMSFGQKGDLTKNIINDGDVETPIRLEIYGPATYPKLTNRETGEFLRVDRILSSGDVVTVTTEFGNKRVELNGENAFNILDLPDSTFLQLDIGDNVMDFTTEDVSDNASVKISYKNRYLGV